MYRRTGRGRLLLLAFVVLAVIVITLDFRENPGGPLKRAKDVSVAIVTPIQRGFTAIVRPVGDFFSSLAELRDAREDNARLERQVEDLEADVERAEALAEQNAELRAELGLEPSWPTIERVTAEVIADDPANYKWAVVIGKGRADGIRPNQAVIDSDGLVGKVIAANQNDATVLLLIDPVAAAAARVNGAGVTGLVRGNGAGEPLSLTLVETGPDVSVGDEVVTSGYDRGIFPAGIPIGVVSEVAGASAALEREIKVESDVNFRALDFVEILVETGPRVTQKEGN